MNNQNCTACEGCTACNHCNHCIDCKHCTGCTACDDCTGCVECFECVGLYNKTRYVNNKPLKLPVPKVKNLCEKVWQAVQQDGAFDMNAWHTCNTTHCWAGWIVTLAGEAGKALEDLTHTPFAASLIFKDSTGQSINPNYFYLSNEQALEKIEELAQKFR